MAENEPNKSIQGRIFRGILDVKMVIRIIPPLIWVKTSGSKKTHSIIIVLNSEVQTVGFPAFLNIISPRLIHMRNSIISPTSSPPLRLANQLYLLSNQRNAFNIAHLILRLLLTIHFSRLAQMSIFFNNYYVVTSLGLALLLLLAESCTIHSSCQP